MSSIIVHWEISKEKENRRNTVETEMRRMIDVHCHIGRLKSEELNTRYAIPDPADASFLFHTLKKVDSVSTMFATPYASPHVGYERSYEWLLSETDRHKSLLPVPIIHPQLSTTASILNELDSDVIPGIKLHCGSSEWKYSLANQDFLAPMFSYARTHALVLFIHTDDQTCLPAELSPLLKTFPSVTVVLLHACKPRHLSLTRFPSVFLETSGCTAKNVSMVMGKHPSRVLFGSDFPFLDYNVSLQKVKPYKNQIEHNEETILKPLM